MSIFKYIIIFSFFFINSIMGLVNNKDVMDYYKQINSPNYLGDISYLHRSKVKSKLLINKYVFFKGEKIVITLSNLDANTYSYDPYYSLEQHVYKSKQRYDFNPVDVSVYFIDSEFSYYLYFKTTRYNINLLDSGDLNSDEIIIDTDVMSSTNWGGISKRIFDNSGEYSIHMSTDFEEKGYDFKIFYYNIEKPDKEKEIKEIKKYLMKVPLKIKARNM